MATTKLFLDTRKSGENSEKEYAVKIAISHKQSTAYILTEVKVRSNQWDKETKKVKDHPQKHLLNKLLLGKLSQVNDFMYELQQGNKIASMNATEVSKFVKERMEQVSPRPQSEMVQTMKKEEDPSSLERLFLRYIEHHDLRDSTVGLYQHTMRKVANFLGNKWHSFSVKQINYAWIEDFEKYLSTTSPSANARAIVLRELKAVCRYAYKLEILQRDPFINFTIRTQKTAKRNISVEALRRIIFAELEPWMEKYRDFFVLSFMLRGLNTVDLCNLPRPKDGRIEWLRTKTNQPLSLKIEPEMLSYIDKWKGSNLLLEHCDQGRPYRNFNNMLSNGLREMVKYINHKYRDGIKVPPVTMYWARHTWATIAASLDIPIDVIGCGLGHSPKGVTEIYIERDPAKVDKANRKILDYVLYDKITEGKSLTKVETPQIAALPFKMEELPSSTPLSIQRKRGHPQKAWKQ